MTPKKSGAGASQLETGSPSPEAGTLPTAIAPATVPMKNGVSTEEMAKVAPAARRPPRPLISLRKAKPAPRRTIPTAARARGM